MKTFALLFLENWNKIKFGKKRKQNRYFGNGKKQQPENCI